MPRPIDPGPVVCPTDAEWEDARAKVGDFEAIASRPDATYSILINVRDGLPPVDESTCEAAGPFVGCEARDAPLVARYERQVDRVQCILERLGPVDGARWWYDDPYYLSDGTVVPILVAFAANVTGTALLDIAGHPFVEGVTTAPDAFGARRECTAERESADGKVEGDPLPSGERQFAIVDYRVPLELPSCAEETCVELERAQETLHVLMTRGQTCVYGHVQATLGELVLLPYFAGGGNPFDITQAYPLAFAVAATLDEARAIASHPEVARVTLTDLEIPIEMRPMPNLNPGPCPTERESIDGKIGSPEILGAAEGAVPVIVGVINGAIPEAPRCPDDRAAQCPEREAFIAMWETQNLEAQRCVRALVTDVGGTASPETTWIINSFEATLTWEQIQAVAAHPHVRHIEPRDTGEIPPPL
jgi:hypothetical protein